MKNLYILQDINEEKLSELKEENAVFIAFDYISHKILAKNKIKHNLIDDYINENDRKEIFQFCSTCLKQYERSNESDLKFHNIDLVSIVDRNELHEFLMDLVPKIKALKKIIDKGLHDTIFVSSDIYEIFSKTKFKSNIKFLNKIEKNLLTLEKVDIPLNFEIMETKFTISRKKYKKLKGNIEKITTGLFRLRKNYKNKKKIVLIEFDPEIYHDLLQEINKHGFQPVLVNFRKTATASLRSIKYLKKSNSLVMLAEDWLQKPQFEEIGTVRTDFLNKIKNMTEYNIFLPNCLYEEIDFNVIIQKKINDILIQRLDEYLTQILVAESIENANDVSGIITLNFSGETEKIFSRIKSDIPVILLQHAFANYTKAISYFDILDDYHLIKHKIAVWGDIIKDYLIHVKAIPENKIIVSGSPKYDSYSRIEKNKKSQKIMLVTLRPIITHMEGPRIELYEKYEKTLHKLIQISKDVENLQIIFKLHPQQNISNQIIINMIKENEGIKILQFEPIKELLADCDLHVNIAPDNFDASSVILEAMMMGKPTLNIQLQKNEIEFEFIKDNAIKSVYYDSNIERSVLDLISHHGTDELFSNSQNFLNKYMKNRGNAAKKLIDSIEDLTVKN
jgi:hypothetical protein